LAASLFASHKRVAILGGRRYDRSTDELEKGEQCCPGLPETYRLPVPRKPYNQRMIFYLTIPFGTFSTIMGFLLVPQIGAKGHTMKAENGRSFQG
jgi:hypothetical protein